jgi:hypothetical protein
MLEKQKYEIVLEAIEKGGATTESLLKLLDSTNKRSLTNQINFINVLKKFPVENKDGVYVILNEEQYVQYLNKTGATVNGGKSKKYTEDPQGKYDKLTYRLREAISLLNKAKAALNNNSENTRLKLKHAIALSKFHLINLDVDDFQKKIAKELGVTVEQIKESEDLNELLEQVKNKVETEVEAVA